MITEVRKKLYLEECQNFKSTIMNEVKDSKYYYSDGFLYEKKSLGGGIYYVPLKNKGKFDEYGVAISIPWQEIGKGDKVYYIDTRNGKNVKGKKKSVKIILYGIWDGEKVQFDDDDNTVVRSIRWLEKVGRTLRKSTIKELKEHYKLLITNSEQRLISYKKQLTELYKDKNLYVTEDFEWLRIYFKEMKTIEERFWKSLVVEWTEIKKDYGI